MGFDPVSYLMGQKAGGAGGSVISETGTLAVGVFGTDSSCNCYMCGNLHIVILCGHVIAATPQSDPLCTVPTAFIPSDRVTAASFLVSRDAGNLTSRVGFYQGYASIETTGELTQTFSNDLSNSDIMLVFIY